MQLCTCLNEIHTAHSGITQPPVCGCAQPELRRRPRLSPNPIQMHAGVPPQIHLPGGDHRVPMAHHHACRCRARASSKPACQAHLHRQAGTPEHPPPCRASATRKVRLAVPAWHLAARVPQRRRQSGAEARQLGGVDTHACWGR